MKMKFVIAALVVGLSGPATAASLLDFTSSAIGTSNTSGNIVGTTFDISGSSNLVDAFHSNDVGCDLGAGYACDPLNDKFDVGFGVQGGILSNEVDMLEEGEYVQVSFGAIVQIHGFAGMLTYNGSQAGEGTEVVKLSVSSDGGVTFTDYFSNTLFTDADNGCCNDTFETVGLSFLSGMENVFGNVVRFSAAGRDPFDNGDANITAAALEVSAIPVPAGLPLLLAGLGAFGWVSRRKKS